MQATFQSKVVSKSPFKNTSLNEKRELYQDPALETSVYGYHTEKNEEPRRKGRLYLSCGAQSSCYGRK